MTRWILSRSRKAQDSISRVICKDATKCPGMTSHLYFLRASRSVAPVERWCAACTASAFVVWRPQITQTRSFREAP